MKKSIYYIGLDVHKETIAVSIAPGDFTEVTASSAAERIRTNAENAK